MKNKMLVVKNKNMPIASCLSGINIDYIASKKNIYIYIDYTLMWSAQTNLS